MRTCNRSKNVNDSPISRTVSAKCFACMHPFDSLTPPGKLTQMMSNRTNSSTNGHIQQTDDATNGSASTSNENLPTTNINVQALPSTINIGTNVFECPKCREKFCSDCESFIHETLHICPGCQSRTKKHVTGSSHFAVRDNINNSDRPGLAMNLV